MLAAGLAIVGLARPVLDAGRGDAGTGPLLLVIDDGWASAADFTARIGAASTSLDRAERAAGRAVALLTTAAPADGRNLAPPTIMPVPDLRARLAALRPKPWPTDREAAARVAGQWHAADTAVVYIADGVAGPPDGDRDFAAALARIGAVTELRTTLPAARLLLPPRAEADRLVAIVAQPPRPAASPPAIVLAQSGDGRSLSRVSITIPPGQGRAEAPIALPPELRNQLGRLVLEGPPSAGAVVLLDERWRRRPVGLLAGDAVSAESPLIGQLYYLRRALSPYSEIRESNLDTLLSRDLSVLIMADRVISDGPEHDKIAAWVEHGGTLVRFAGPPPRRTSRRPAAGPPARRRSPARRGDVLEPAGPARAVHRDLAVRRPRRHRRGAGQPPGARRTLRRPDHAQLGEPDRRHPAGHRGRPRRRADRAVPRHRQCRLVQPAALRSVRGHAPPGGQPVGRHRRHRRYPGAGAERDPGWVRRARRAAAGGCGAGRARLCHHHRLAAPPAGALRSREQPARAEPGRRTAAAPRPRRRSPAHARKAWARSPPSGRSGPG